MKLNESILSLAVIGSLSASAFAQNNNTGDITVQGVVPVAWELTVYDINSGYDFDLTSNAGDLTTRIGTIHIFSNETKAASGHLIIESANAGRLINRSTGPGIAAEHQAYTFDLVANALYEIQINEDASNLNPLREFQTTPNDHNLIVPATVSFVGNSGSGDRTLALEARYDVMITIPGTQRPQASGVYTDTITFTMIDDG